MLQLMLLLPSVLLLPGNLFSVLHWPAFATLWSLDYSALLPSYLLVVSTTGHLNVDLFYTFIVVLQAIGVNVLYALGRRKFTDVEKMRRYNAEMKAFRQEMSAATKAGDKTKIEKLKKKQQQMQKMQAEMSMQNLKPTLLFMAPLMGVYYLMSYFIQASVLAISPIIIPLVVLTIPIQLNFFWWYMICSFTFSGIISRLFGLAMD